MAALRRTHQGGGAVRLSSRPRRSGWIPSLRCRPRVSGGGNERSSDAISTSKPSRPCARGLRLLLEAFDLVLLDHGKADIVEAVEQTVLAMRIDVELHHAAIGTSDLLLLQVDRQRRIGAALGVVEQLLQILRLDLDRQHAVLEAVVVEDVAERGRDHATDAEVHQRPRRVLARGAATEIVTGDQNFGLAIGRLVEHEVRVLAAVVAIALLREQARAKPRALDGLEILLGNDHVGIDVDHLERCCDAFERGEFVHELCPVTMEWFCLMTRLVVCQVHGRVAGAVLAAQLTLASIAAMSWSERPKWWPISCTSTWVMIAPNASSCSAQ